MENLFKGNEVDLDEVLELAKKTAERVAQKEEDQLEKFRAIVKGVAKKYASKYVDREDLEQELWIVVLELVANHGGEENLDPRLVAKSCFNKAVDFYRYSRRRVDTSARLIDESESEEFESSASSKLDLTAKGRSAFDEVLLKEVIDLFPVGSRERKYVVTKLYMFGEIDQTSGLHDELEFPEDDTEEAVLKLMGYASRYPASWGKMKWGIKEKIFKYFGHVPEQWSEESNQRCIKNRLEEIFKESTSGYIGIDRLVKDSILKILHCDKEAIDKAVAESSTLLRGRIAKGYEFVMKNKEKYLENSKKTGDVIYFK